jgi:hypothetical protein
LGLLLDARLRGNDFDKKKTRLMDHQTGSRAFNRYFASGFS